MIKLFHHPVSTCSQKVRLVLYHKQIEWQSCHVDLLKGEHLTEAYLAINPNGVVPTLVDRGNPICDSSAIVEYLEDAYPERPLRPADLLECGNMRAWCRYIDEVPTPSVRVPSFNKVFSAAWRNVTDEDRKRHAERLPIRKHWFLRMKRDGFDKEETLAAYERLRSCFERMERALSRSKWIACDDYSLADISLTPSIVRLDDLGEAILWEDLPRVQAWYARIQSLDNFGPAFAAPARDLWTSVPGLQSA
jgi:glutathione S-transferase